MIIGVPVWLQWFAYLGELVVEDDGFARRVAWYAMAYALLALGSLFYALAAAVAWGVVSGQLYGCS